MLKKSRLERYFNKFKSDTPPRSPKKTLGQDLSEQLVESVKKRMEEIIPLYCTRSYAQIQTNAASFWDRPEKQISITVLITFDEKTVWKDGE